jgi:hypothetical protein
MASPGQAPTGLRVHVLTALTATCFFENPVPLCYLNAWQACCGPGLAFLASPPSNRSQKEFLELGWFAHVRR